MTELGGQDETGGNDRVSVDEITLTFESRIYHLNEFKETMEGIEALLTLGSITEQGLEMQLQFGGEPVLQASSIPSWYESQREAVSSNIIVEKVSLSSPLEIILIAGYMSTQLALMLRSWIGVKNAMHRSHRLAAETNSVVARAAAEREAYEFLGNVFAGRIPIKDAKPILSDPTIRKVLEQATKPMQHLQSIEVNARPVDSEDK
jgi:hypothetical protein